MVQTMIRLQNHGKKNHKYWWIVIQPKNKCLKGRVIEKVGLWIPRKTHTLDRAVVFNKYKLRYWLSVGAVPSEKVQHLLTMIDFLPKKPMPFGSAQKLERKPRTYKMEYFHNHRWAFDNKENQRSYYYGKIKELEALMNRHLDLEKSAIDEIIQPENINLKYDKKQNSFEDDMDTDGINSDEEEFFSRKKNFDIISKKLDKYMSEKFHLFKGNDLKYNNYVRKIQKLSMKQSLDIEGYKDYIENLKNISDTKNKTLQNIAKIYLKDLTERENFSEITKQLKLEGELDLNLLDKNKIISSSDKNSELIIESLYKSFDVIAENLFNLDNEKKEEIKKDESYKDIINLRIAKMCIKLNVQAKNIKHILNSEDYLKEENLDLFPFLNDEFVLKLESKLDSISEDLKKNPDTNFNLTEKNEFENNLFEKLNNFVMSNDTLKKYSSYIIENKNQNNQNSNSENFLENIFSINSEAIDKLIILLVNKLSKNYELNEIFRDEISDLAKFEMEENLRNKKRFEMKKEIFNLKQKHGDDLNLLYDDYMGKSEEIKSDVRKFKENFSEDFEAELDIHFKETFKLLIDKREKEMHKYEDAEEFEKDKKFLQWFEEIQNRIMEEIRLKQAGKFKEENNPEKANEGEDEENEEQKAYKSLEGTIRYMLTRKFLNEVPLYGHLLPKLFDDDVPLEPKLIEVPRRAFKGHKVPNEEEKVSINRRIQRLTDVLNYSHKESQVIEKERIDLIIERFVEYFGRYNSTIFPDGFRHLESFEVYQSLYPLRNMSEYIAECRGICDFNKFVEIVFGTINQIKKIILLGFEFPELSKKLNYLPVYLHTKRPEFFLTLKEIFKRNLQISEKKNSNFTVFDALEYMASFEVIDSVLPEITEHMEEDDEMKLYELVSTHKYSTVKLHEIDSPKNQDLGFNRQGPFMPINPLKAHKANPYMMKPDRKFKNNFPYKMRSRGFCTKISNMI